MPRSSMPYRMVLPPMRYSGVGILGDSSPAATQTSQYVGAALGLATPIISAAAASSAAASLAAGGTGLILGMAPTLALPIIGAAMMVVTTLITVLIRNSGCGQTCVETSAWANQAEPLLVQNIQAYFALPSPRTVSQQQAALANFVAIWTTLVNQCSQAGTGNAGVRCISDRQAGACTWKQTTTSVLLSIPGEPQPGECWNWYSGYHDPIMNDQVVADDANAVAQVAANQAASTSTTLSGSSMYLFGAVALIAIAMLGGNN